MTASVRERAARALCRRDGHPENITFESKPMWQSYLDVVDAVLAASADGPLRKQATKLVEDWKQAHGKPMLSPAASEDLVERIMKLVQDGETGR